MASNWQNETKWTGLPWHSPFNAMGHFRVRPGLCNKTRLSAQPLIRKWFFILMQIKTHFHRKGCVSTWPHFESEGFWNSEVAYWRGQAPEGGWYGSPELSPTPPFLSFSFLTISRFHFAFFFFALCPTRKRVHILHHLTALVLIKRKTCLARD